LKAKKHAQIGRFVHKFETHPIFFAQMSHFVQTKKGEKSEEKTFFEPKRIKTLKEICKRNSLLFA